MTPKAEPQSEEVTLLWRIGAICCCCLVVIVVMIIANPLAMSKLLGGNLRNWHEVELYLLISNWLMKLTCVATLDQFRLGQWILDFWMKVHQFRFFWRVIGVLSLLDRPILWFSVHLMLFRFQSNATASRRSMSHIWVMWDSISFHLRVTFRMSSLLQHIAPCFFAAMWSSKSPFWGKVWWLENDYKKGTGVQKAIGLWQWEVWTFCCNLSQKILLFRLQGRCMTCMMNIEIASDIIDILHSLIFMSAPTSFKDNWRSGRDWKGDTHGREGYLQASRWYLWKHWSVELPKTYGVFCWWLDITWVFLWSEVETHQVSLFDVLCLVQVWSWWRVPKFYSCRIFY